MKKKPEEERDPAAVQLGRKGGKSRWKNKTAPEISAEMKRVRKGKG